MWVPEAIASPAYMKKRIERIARAIPEPALDPRAPGHNPRLRQLYRMLISHSWDDKGLDMIRLEIEGELARHRKEREGSNETAV